MDKLNLTAWALRGHTEYEEKLERALAASQKQLSRYENTLDRANDYLREAKAAILELEAKVATKELEVEKLQNRLKPFLALEAEQKEKEEREAAERLAKETQERVEKARQAKEELLAALNAQMTALQQQIEQVKNN